ATAWDDRVVPGACQTKKVQQHPDRGGQSILARGALAPFTTTNPGGRSRWSSSLPWMVPRNPPPDSGGGSVRPLRHGRAPPAEPVAGNTVPAWWPSSKTIRPGTTPRAAAGVAPLLLWPTTTRYHVAGAVSGWPRPQRRFGLALLDRLRLDH